MASQTKYYTTVIRQGRKRFSGPRIEAQSYDEAKEKAKSFGYISSVTDPLIEEQHPGELVIK